MTLVNDIVNFLSSAGEFHAIWYGSTEWLSSRITGINTDQEAQMGELAWISPKQAKTHPEHIASFEGSLLIGPHGAISSGVPFVACDNPKLAFIRVVDKFFHDLVCIKWPKPGEYESSDAVVAEDVTLSAGVIVGSGVTMESGVVIGPNTVIANCTIKSGVRIGANCSIGLPGFGYEKDENGRYWRFPHVGRVVIEEDVEIGSNTCVDRGDVV